jgi:hypothetical protein
MRQMALLFPKFYLNLTKYGHQERDQQGNYGNYHQQPDQYKPRVFVHKTLTVLLMVITLRPSIIASAYPFYQAIRLGSSNKSGRISQKWLLTPG